MSVPYYYSENPSGQDQSLDFFFRYAKQKLANISESSRQQDPTNAPGSLLKAFQSQPQSSPQDSRLPTKHSIENCLQFPYQREYKSPLVNTENKSDAIRNPLIMNCLEGYINKARGRPDNVDLKAENTLNRLKLNEFLFNQERSPGKEDNRIDYSNIKEYKFSQTVGRNGMGKEFTPVKSASGKTKMEKTKKGGRNFLTPNKARESPAGVNEFPLNELSATLKPSKKHKKRIFDLSYLEELKRSSIQPYFEKLSDFLNISTQKGKKMVSPDPQRFYRKFRIIDKDGEDKSRVFLKKTLLDSIGVIFENFELKIAMKTQLFESQSKDEHGLLIMLYYCNKNKGDLQDCCLRFADSKSIYF